MKKAVITGPTGAVGVALIEELLAHHVEVTAVCRPASGRMGQIPRHPLVQVVQCDLSQLPTLGRQLLHDYDTFYHFGWDGPFGEARQDLTLQTQNVLYTLEAVKLAQQLGCTKFIGAGSQSEFGHVDGVLHPYMPCMPDNGYGIAKLAAGWMSRLECQKRGLQHHWCRIVSTYGRYDGDYTLIMSTILRFLDGKSMQFTKGDQIWDYLYNKDAARAFRLVAEKGKDGSLYCFGTGNVRPLKAYIEIIRDQINPAIPLRFGELPYYPNQVMHLQADIANLTEDTGFIPSYTFEQGIAETIAWVKEKKRHE